MLRRGTFVAVRSARASRSPGGAVRQTVWSSTPISPFDSARCRCGWMNSTRPAFNMLLFGVFALVALLLAAVGIYGVLAYSGRAAHARDRHSPGPGATRDVLWLIVGQGLALTLIGVALGLVAAWP